MSIVKYIIDLAEGRLSLDGYSAIVSQIKRLLVKNRWPKVILEGFTNIEGHWSEDEILSFTQQFLLHVLNTNKLKNCNKIPEGYLEYYFQTIIMSYVASKIKGHQNETRLSYDDVKRISLNILNQEFHCEEKMGVKLWNKEAVFIYPTTDEAIIIDLVSALPKIRIKDRSKHFKPLVKTAIVNLFNIVDGSIKQSVLIDQVYNLFDQSSFDMNNEEMPAQEMRIEILTETAKKISEKIDRVDIPLILEYFFSETNISMSILGEKFDMPKSTVQYKTSQFKKVIFEMFIPENENEGVRLLEILHQILVERR
jgi:hypothetical protein